MIGSPGSPISEFVQFVDANISVFMDLPIQLLATEEETNTVPTENSTPTKESPTAPETFKKNTRWTPEEAVDNLFSKLGTYKSNSRKILLKFCSSGLKEDAELRLRARSPSTNELCWLRNWPLFWQRLQPVYHRSSNQPKCTGSKFP